MLSKMLNSRFSCFLYDLDEIIAKKLMKITGLLVIAVVAAFLLAIGLAPFALLIYGILSASLTELVRGALIGFVIFAVLGSLNR
jgi:hypothetical protein